MKAELKTVLHVSSTDVAGGRFNGLMIGPELVKKGIISKMAVFHKTGTDPNTRQLFAARRYFRLNKISEFFERSLSIHSLLYFWSPMRLLFDQKNFKTDLYHLHLIHNGFFSLFFLPLLTRLRPTVWTIHDPWAMTGRCVYSMGCEGWKTGCGICPDLNTHFVTQKDRSALMWKIKKWVYALSKFEIVVASKYMESMVRKSPLLREKRVHVVPFGLDVELFRETDQETAQKRLGVFPGSFVISFRSNGGVLKGTQYIVEALRQLKTEIPICLVSFEGRGFLDEFRGRYQIIDLGWVNAEDTFVDAYNAADVFLMPSVEEAFGMMAMEAMACGTPVIVFEGTSLPEVINAPEGGIAVPLRDASALKRAIEKLIGSPDELERLGRSARALAAKRYQLQPHVDAIYNVYLGVFERWHRGETGRAKHEALESRREADHRSRSGSVSAPENNLRDQQPSRETLRQ